MAFDPSTATPVDEATPAAPETVTPQFDPSTATPVEQPDTQPVQQLGSFNETVVNRALSDAGWSPTARAGLLGDIKQESDFKPTLAGDRGTSHGLFQTGTAMYRQFQREAESRGIFPNDPTYPYAQAQFVMERFREQHPARAQAMQEATDAQDVIKIFRGTPDWGYGVAGNRYRHATNYQNKLGTNGEQPSAPGTSYFDPSSATPVEEGTQEQAASTAFDPSSAKPVEEGMTIGGEYVPPEQVSATKAILQGQQNIGHLQQTLLFPTSPQFAQMANEAKGGMTVAGQMVPPDQAPTVKAVLQGQQSLDQLRQTLLFPTSPEFAQMAKEAKAQAPGVVGFGMERLPSGEILNVRTGQKFPAPPTGDEEIRATTAADRPAQIASAIGRGIDNFFTPPGTTPPDPYTKRLYPEHPPIIPEDVAKFGVKLAGYPMRVLTRGIQQETGLPVSKIEQGVENSIAKNVSAFTNLETLASLPAFAIPGVAEAFGVGIAAKLPEQYGHVSEVIERHGLFSPEAWESITDAGLQDTIGLLAFKGGKITKGVAKDIRDVAEMRRVMGEEANAPTAPTPPAAAVPPPTTHGIGDTVTIPDGKVQGQWRVSEINPDFTILRDPATSHEVTVPTDSLERNIDQGNFPIEKTATAPVIAAPEEALREAVEPGDVTSSKDIFRVTHKTPEGGTRTIWGREIRPNVFRELNEEGDWGRGGKDRLTAIGPDDLVSKEPAGFSKKYGTLKVAEIPREKVQTIPPWVAAAIMGHELPDEIRLGVTPLETPSKTFTDAKSRYAERGHYIEEVNLGDRVEGPDQDKIDQGIALAKSQGVKLHWIRGTGGTVFTRRGFAFRGEMFLNVDMLKGGGEPLHLIAGHEIAHTFETNHPDLYHKLVSTLRVKPESEFLTRFVEQGHYTPQEFPHELVANLFEETLRDPATFTRSLADRPKLMQQVANVIKQWIDKALRKLGLVKPETIDPKSASAAIENLEGMRRTITQVLEEGRRRATQAAGEAPIRERLEEKIGPIGAVMKAIKGKDMARVSSEEEFFGKIWPKLLRATGLTTRNPLVAAERAVADMATWLKNNPKFKDYYEKDFKASRQLMERGWGRKVSDAHFRLFRLLNGIMSQATPLKLNTRASLNGVKHFIDNGNFDAIKTRTVSGIDSSGRPYTARSIDPNNAFAIAGGAPAGVAFNVGHVLNNLIKRFGGGKKGIMGAIDYLEEGVSKKELNAFNKEVGFKGDVGNIGAVEDTVKFATGQSEKIPRMFIFGKKIGAYTLNNLGDHRFNTTDVWESRFVKSYFKGMLEKNPGIAAGADEHQLFTRFVERFNERWRQEVNPTEKSSGLQAGRWFNIIEASTKAGYTRGLSNDVISQYVKEHFQEGQPLFAPGGRFAAAGGGLGAEAGAGGRPIGELPGAAGPGRAVAGREGLREAVERKPQVRAGARQPGAAAEFFSSSTNPELDFQGAADELRGPRHARMEAINAHIDNFFGLGGVAHSGIGDTAKWGAENTIVNETPEGKLRDFAELEYLSAIKGKLLGQKSVLAFWHGDGADALWRLSVPTRDFADIRHKMTEAGLEFRTFLQDGNRTGIKIFDEGHKLTDNVVELATDYGIKEITYDKGKGKFVGDSPTREEAGRKFDAVARDYEARNPNRQHYRGGPGNYDIGYPALEAPRAEPAAPAQAPAGAGEPIREAAERQDESVQGAKFIGTYGADMKKWSNAMHFEFGDAILPRLQEIYPKAVALHAEATIGDTAGAAKTAPPPQNSAGKQQFTTVPARQDAQETIDAENAKAGAPAADANRVNDAKHNASIQAEQNEVPDGTKPDFFGPGAASVQQNLATSSQIKQLTATVTKALATKAPVRPTVRMAKAIGAVGRTVAAPARALVHGVNTVRAGWLAMKNGFLRPWSTTDFMDVIKDWQGADQRASFEARKFINTINKTIRDPMTQEAITNYIEADGDMALLQQRAAASGVQDRAGYEAAMKLNPDQQAFADNVRQYFDGMIQDGINSGILDHGVANYITHLWKKANKITNMLQADLQSGSLQTSFKYARKRIFDSFFEGEQAGHRPLTKEVGKLIATYDLSFNRALSARAMVKGLREAKAADGMPVVKLSGMTQPVPDGAVPPEAYLIRSRAKPSTAITADGRPYRVLDHPALRGWKYVIQDGSEIPMYYQADMLVHPDHYNFLRNVLTGSAFRQGAVGVVTKPFFKVGALAKQTKLSLSLFHMDQEGLHGLFHRVNPANLDKINFDDPTQWMLVRNGLQVADYHAMELFAEGVSGGGLVAKVPVLGPLQVKYNEWLFKDYIPRLKMTMALHAYERNLKRYPGLSPDIVAELTANQGNAAFGELNYKMLGRSATVQDALRLVVLAPDFLEARGRFVGQALKPYGKEQRAALLLGMATMYVTGRVLNQVLDNDPHWDKPFSVIYNGREYRLRTVQGDAWELVTDPRRFFYNRFSPWLKAGVTYVTGRDWRGVKLNTMEQIKDALSWFIPIPVGGSGQPATPGQRVLGSLGVSNKPSESPADIVYKSALKFKEGLTDPKVRQEVRRAQQETYVQGDYAKLNRAIIDKDSERATVELISLMKDKGKTAVDIVQNYKNFPFSPFTGSKALELQWQGQMSPVELARYQKAVEQRADMSAAVLGLLPNATIEAQKP